MKEKIFSYSYMGDSGSVHKLPLLEQLRLLLRQVFNNETAENEVQESLIEYEMELKADTMAFIEKSVKPLSEGKHKTVRVELASRYIDVLPYVVDLPIFKKYYDFEYTIPSNEYGLDYMLIIDISVKGGYDE